MMRRLCSRSSGLLLCAFAFTVSLPSVPAASIVSGLRIDTPESVEVACTRFLALARQSGAAWSSTEEPAIRGSWDLVTGDTLRARCYAISPAGHVLIDAENPAHPVIAYSDACELRPETHPEIVRYLSEGWAGRDAAESPRSGGGGALLDGVGPLLTSAWHQRFPYDRFCPMGDGGRTSVGCLITATTQIMRYHEWPKTGAGEHSFTWDGDQSCGGNVGGGVLSATFSDAYDWINMPDECDGGCVPAQEDALAELCYEVGVAGEADYGHCGTPAWESVTTRALVDHFRYDDTIVKEIRSSYTAESWFALIQSEIDLRAPILYSNGGHAWVCDGWRVLGGSNQIHINWGTDENDYTGWWNLDQMPDTPDPMHVYLYRGIRPLCRVAAEGGDFTTIQAAIDYCPGPCSVILAPGIHVGDGNRDILLAESGIMIRGESESPEQCILDCGGSEVEPHRAFRLAVGSSITLQGFTIRGGFADRGGGILCSGGCTLSVLRMLLDGNTALEAGGGIYANSAVIEAEGSRFLQNRALSGGGIALDLTTSSVSRCEFVGNESAQGGAILILGADLTLDHCTFYRNAGESSCIVAGDGAAITAANTIVAASTAGSAASCSGDGSLHLTCSDLWGNAGGDWVGCIETQAGTAGNFSADPRFCDPGADDLQLDWRSPCAPDQNQECWVVGANPVGCASDSILIVRADGTGQHRTIQAAIDAWSDGMVILLGSGTYRGDGNRDIDLRGKAITLRSEAFLPESCRIECEGMQYPDQQPHRGILLNNVSQGQARIQGITIRGGHMVMGSGPEQLGGAAILCVGSSALIERCILEENTATGSGNNTYGGALCAEGSTLRVQDCLIRGNVSEFGGGVAALRSALEIIDCEVALNEASRLGGGVACHASSRLYASGSVLESNEGSGLSLLLSDATVLNVIFRTGVSRGGAHIEQSDASFTRCVFDGNQGGGLSLESGTAEVSYSTFHGNSSQYGGAMYNWNGFLDVSFCTLYGNDASSGGGIFTYSDVSIRNAIIASSSNGAVKCGQGGLSVELSCCDLVANGGGSWTGCIAGQSGQNGNISADPLFCDAAGSHDFHLREGSPCLPPNGGCDQIGAWGAGCGLTMDAEAAPRVRRLALGPIVPNPSCRGVRISVTVPDGTRTARPRLTLHTVTGRMIRDLTPGLPAPGVTGEVEWDGLDSGGRRVAAGVYHCVLRDGTDQRASRLVLLRSR